MSNDTPVRLPHRVKQQPHAPLEALQAVSIGFNITVHYEIGVQPHQIRAGAPARGDVGARIEPASNVATATSLQISNFAMPTHIC